MQGALDGDGCRQALVVGHAAAAALRQRAGIPARPRHGESVFPAAVREAGCRARDAALPDGPAGAVSLRSPVGVVSDPPDAARARSANDRRRAGVRRQRGRSVPEEACAVPVRAGCARHFEWDAVAGAPGLQRSGARYRRAAPASRRIRRPRHAGGRAGKRRRAARMALAGLPVARAAHCPSGDSRRRQRTAADDRTAWRRWPAAATSCCATRRASLRSTTRSATACATTSPRRRRA